MQTKVSPWKQLLGGGGEGGGGKSTLHSQKSSDSENVGLDPSLDEGQ